MREMTRAQSRVVEGKTENQMDSTATQIKSTGLNHSLEVSGKGDKVAKLAQSNG